MKMLYSVVPLTMTLGVSRLLSLGILDGQSVQKKSHNIEALKGNIQLEITKTEN